MVTYACCQHCELDQPHVDKDSHDLPCTFNGCQSWSEADARAEIDRLKQEATKWRDLAQQMHGHVVVAERRVGIIARLHVPPPTSIYALEDLARARKVWEEAT